MVELKNSEINVDELMKGVCKVVAQNKEPSNLKSIVNSRNDMSRMLLNINNIEALLENAKSRACARQKWPEKFNYFPFNINLSLQKKILKFLNFIFKDQREVNFNLINSLRESLVLNKQLIEKIAILSGQIHDHSIVINSKVQVAEQFTQEHLQTLVEEEHLLDAFYVAFEEKFRGSYEDVTNRFKIHLPLIEEAKIGTIQSPILDIGCGRGEWIDLLQKSGYVAKGLDINTITIEECRAKGLDVTALDAITYLKSLQDKSIGALTGFHIIEHLPFETLIKLFDEAVRVLIPGGLVIFETPNPQNVIVGSNTFYLDPTHRNPLPSPMIKFMAESQGLDRVRIIDLHPYPENFRLTGSDVAERFSDLFYGPQDYAVIGYKV